MGMFDSVICHYPLPVPEHQKYVFQTKNLECMMDTYIITAEGRLVVEVMNVVCDSTAPLGYRLEKTDETFDLELHGDLYFYHYVNYTDEFIEYIARFTNGTVESIERLPSEE